MTSLASPKNLHDYLQVLNKKPSKALSQNFLIDQNVVHKFIQQMDLSKEDIVLEIGAGPGALTQIIAPLVSKLIVVEKDHVFTEGLKKQYSDLEHVEVYEDDILSCDLEAILPKDKKIKVISNLPFQLTSPILGRLLPLYEQISSMHFIMQQEFAERILAKSKTKSFSSLTVFSKFYSSPKLGFNISSSCFFPKPNVNSTVVHFDLHSPILEDASSFFEFVRSGFKQRRKMLSSTLPYPSIEVQQALEKIELSAKSRPEELNIQEWIELYKLLKP